MVPTTTDSVVFDGSHSGTGACSYNTTPVTIGAITFNSGYTATFSSATSANILIVTGSTLDLRSGGIITGQNLIIEFNGGSAQTFYPATTTDTLQGIMLYNSGTVTVSTNGFRADSIFFNYNPTHLNLGTGLTHTLISTSPSLECYRRMGKYNRFEFRNEHYLKASWWRRDG